jgi:hypothetical protein
MIKLLAMAALLGSTPVVAPPAAPRCLTRQQAGDLSVVGMAIMVEGARNACRPHLAATAFLMQPGGTQFAARLRDEGRRRFASAAEAVARLGGGQQSGPMAMVRTVMNAMLNEGVGAEFSANVDAALCRDANDMIEALSAMSPDQISRFSAGAMSLASQMATRMTAPRRPTAAPPPPAAGATPRPASFDPGRPPVQMQDVPPVPDLSRLPPPPPPRPRPPIVCPE